MRYDKVLRGLQGRASDWADIVSAANSNPEVMVWKKQLAYIESLSCDGIVRDANVQLAEAGAIVALWKLADRPELESYFIWETQMVACGFPLLPDYGTSEKRQEFFYMCLDVLVKIMTGKFVGWQRCNEKYLTLYDIEQLKEIRRKMIPEPMFYTYAVIGVFLAILAAAILERR
jgi:hypothetical protein